MTRLERLATTVLVAAVTVILSLGLKKWLDGFGDELDEGGMQDLLSWRDPKQQCAAAPQTTKSGVRSGPTSTDNNLF